MIFPESPLKLSGNSFLVNKLYLWKLLTKALSFAILAVCFLMIGFLWQISNYVLCNRM